MKIRLKLYIIGNANRSERTIRNLNQLCDNIPEGDCEIAIIDVLERPELADNDKIIATPTLIRVHPSPCIQIVGELTDLEKTSQELGFVETVKK